MAATCSTSTSSAWRRSVRRRTPVSQRKEDERELGRRVEKLEEAVEGLRGEKDAAEAEETALHAELDAERGAAETVASETMLMIERLQREKAAALLEARQFRRLAKGRDERGRQLQDELASLSAIAGGYLSLLRAHAIEPDDEDGRLQQEDAGMDVIKGVFVQKSPPPPPAAKELEYTADLGCATTTKAMMAVGEEQRVVVVHGAVDLYARVEALEADRAATLREMASMRAEPARVVLGREMARRLCRDAVAAERSGCVATVHKPRFSAPAICKWLFSIILRRKRCSTVRLTFGLSTALIGLLVLLERSASALHRRRLRPPRLPHM
ncbi:uncharacterized protein [Lolium perenne]|uniref:uncharacterized protein n=1 Tax=Lolium perenne TaxID=4522 RepID=UPI0021F5B5BB|nr:uncharacterized protein LOC127333850 [Lolium perenne]